MTTRTFRRSEWVAVLATTLVVTLIATMFAFTSAAHATDSSRLTDETPLGRVSKAWGEAHVRLAL